MFVLDGSASVRQVNMATRVVTTLAGGGGPPLCASTNTVLDGLGTVSIFNQPNSLAADNDHVWVADYNSWRIRKVVISTGVTTSFAGGNNAGYGVDKGGTLAYFAAPMDCVLDGFNNLAIVSGMQCVFSLTLDDTAWSTLVAGKNLRSGQCDQGYGDGLASTAAFGLVRAITVGPTAYYVSDSLGGTIRKIDGSTALSVATKTATPTVSPTVSPSRTVTPSASPPPIVLTTVVGGPGGGLANGVGTLALFNKPSGIATTSDTPPHFIIADNSNNVMRKVSPGGVVTTLAGGNGLTADGTGSSAGFWQPRGVAKAVQGGVDYFYIADCFSCSIRKMSATGVVTSVLRGTTIANNNKAPADGVGTNAYISCPSGIAVDSSGLLHVSGFYDARIRRVTDPGASVTTLAGSTTNIGFAGQTLDGSRYNFADGTGTSAKFLQPFGLAFGASDQSLYVADSMNNALRVVSPLGVVTTLGPHTNTATSTFLLNGPQSVFYWQGEVYVGDTYQLRMVYPDGSTAMLAGQPGNNGYLDGSGAGTSSMIGANWQGPAGLLVSPHDNLLYFCDTGNSMLRTVRFTYPSVTSTASPTLSPTPSSSPTPTFSPTMTPSVSPSAPMTPSVTPSHSGSPSVTPSHTPTPTLTPSQSATATLSPTPTASPSPSPTQSV